MSTNLPGSAAFSASRAKLSGRFSGGRSPSASGEADVFEERADFAVLRSKHPMMHMCPAG
jgi:hypothetical protein